MAEQENATPAVGSDEYNEQMVNKYRTQEADGDTGEELVPIAGMPEGGFDKFYDDKTGNYSWENHAKELAYRLESTTKPRRHQIHLKRQRRSKFVPSTNPLDLNEKIWNPLIKQTEISRKPNIQP